MSARCPHKCHCFYQPSQNKTVVNCRTILSSKKFPLVLPEHENFALDFSKNLISDLDYQLERAKNYTFHIKEINLAGNNFDIISEFAVSQLKRTTMINMIHNPITSIDRSLRNLRPCNVQLGRLDIVCTCTDLWFQSWLPSSTMPCYNNTRIFCKTETGYKSITQVSKSDLGCIEDYHLKWFNLIIGILLSLVVIFAFTGYHFYLEIYILWRRFFGKISRQVSGNSFQYDIYISCNDEDDGLRDWISNELLPHLNDRGLKSFLPYRDCQLGRPREEEIIDTISKSKTVLVLLSDLNQLTRKSTKTWISCEWKYAWLNYREDYSKNVIIINYDFLNNRDVSNRYIQAFMRASICIDFSNYRKNMWSTLYSSLGLSSPSLELRYHRFQNSLDTASIHLQM
ncbi:toll-like receptor 8 [Mytilus trossulus]|uniref:toll-like receptor 8 n=1 Tax=Mytilus trossulus TaxID=6551 RepID=UPI0030048A96